MEKYIINITSLSQFYGLYSIRLYLEIIFRIYGKSIKYSNITNFNNSNK